MLGGEKRGEVPATWLTRPVEAMAVTRPTGAANDRDPGSCRTGVFIDSGKAASVVSPTGRGPVMGRGRDKTTACSGCGGRGAGAAPAPPADWPMRMGSAGIGGNLRADASVFLGELLPGMSPKDAAMAFCEWTHSTCTGDGQLGHKTSGLVL